MLTPIDPLEKWQRNAKEFEKQNANIGIMLWNIIGPTFNKWAGIHNYWDDEEYDPADWNARLSGKRPALPDMTVDFDRLRIVVRQGYDESTIFMNPLVEARYVKLRSFNVSVYVPDGDDREDFTFSLHLDEADDEFKAFSCMVDRYSQMHSAWCELDDEAPAQWQATLRAKWDKFNKWLDTAHMVHKLGHHKVNIVQ